MMVIDAECVELGIEIVNVESSYGEQGKCYIDKCKIIKTNYSARITTPPLPLVEILPPSIWLQIIDDWFWKYTRKIEIIKKAPEIGKELANG